MAGSSLLALIDDIASLLDDVAVLSKVAAKKTAGVLGDDLALNAEQVAGVKAERELPVVWAVFKGSLLNKLILVPAALAISATLPVLIIPLLMLGGAYLCFEGFEKLAHKSGPPQGTEAGTAMPELNPQQLAEFEREKIKGAIRTDFVLSAEIIVITLGTVAQESFARQAMVLSTIALLMTLGVYGLVAAIVKMDDAGLWLSRRALQRPAGHWLRALSWGLGQGLLRAAPKLMHTLAVLGTVAMFLVGGGIFVHNWPTVHHWVHAWAEHAGQHWPLGAVWGWLMGPVADLAAGLAAGALAFVAVQAWQRLRPHSAQQA
jgi:predicted DNA repair protein MutK